MNYSKIYDNLMKRAVCRILESYTEEHHIIPRCLGGTDDPANLVNLTPSEHFLAHQLLVKMHPENTKLLYAARMMTFGSRDNTVARRNNKFYSWMKQRHATRLKTDPIGFGNKSMTGKKHSPETREKMRLAHLGKKKPLTQEGRERLIASNKRRAINGISGI